MSRICSFYWVSVLINANRNLKICCIIYRQKTQKYSLSKCMLRHDVVRIFCVFPYVSFCTGHFVMVPLNMTYLHCLQHSLFEPLFNLYWNVCYRGLLYILRVAVLKHRSLFQTMVVVTDKICMNIIIFIFFYHSS